MKRFPSSQNRPGRSRPQRKQGDPGAPPGTLLGRADAKPSRVVLWKFGPSTFEETLLENVDALVPAHDASHCLWVEVTGLADTKTVAALGRAFGLHELSLEDVFDPAQRPKVEHYEEYTFVVLKTLRMAQRVEAHQLNIFVGEHFVVTLQDGDDPAIEPIRERLRSGRGRIRSGAPDYFAYALIDTVIDHYFPVIEGFDDGLELVEDAVLESDSADAVDLARRARHDLQTIRHAVWPAREVVTALLREDVTRVSDETRMHLRDCYDHVVQLQEMVEASREIAASLLEAYLSRVSLRTNDIMKVLTMIATIFIPLTFLTGLYGMNFNPRSSPLNMPELDWYWGYPATLLVMLVVAVGWLLFFRSKGWFGRRKP